LSGVGRPAFFSPFLLHDASRPMSIGIPVKLLHEAAGHVVTVR
jgi:hypothetical protein